MRSIKNKILFVVIAGLLIITAVVSAVAVNMTHEIMHTDADRILKNMTQKEAAYINDTLGDMVKSAQIMEHYATVGFDKPDQLRDKAFLEQYLQKMQKMFSEIALNTNGVEGYFLRLAPEFTDTKTGFYNVVGANGTVQSMPVTDLAKYPANDEKNVGWYYTPIVKGEATWLDPYYFPGYDVPLISYTVPMYVDSQLIGVLGFDMNFGYLLQSIDAIAVYDNGYAVLLSEDGSVDYTNVEAKESVNPHTSSSATLLNGMKLELRAEYKDIQSNIHPMLQQIVFAFLIVLACAIVYTIVVTHRIVRPLKQLTEAAEKVSLGVSENGMPEFPVGSKDEVGTLAQVMQATYAKMQEYTSYINALAYRDSLTGIKNSTAYTEAIVELNKEINLGNPHFGVIVADINNLKQTNDRFGHDVGNELIVHTAKILTEVFQDSLVFRIGGDEFVVVLKDGDFARYHNRLQSFEDACQRYFVTVDDQKIPVSVARGVSVFDPAIDRVYEDVFAKADHAMYLDKQSRKAALT